MTENMHNLVELPDESLLKILEYLRIGDIKNIRLACKRLNYLSLDKTITKNECLLLNERVFKQNAPSVIAALMASIRNFEVLIFQNDCIYSEAQLPVDHLRGVIVKFGSNIKEVYYYDTNKEFSLTFKTVIYHCPNLESICIKDCFNLFLHESFQFGDRRLLRMKSLKIYKTQYMSDLILHRLFKLCPNLNAITLSCCNINVHNGVYGKFYHEEPSESLMPSNDVFNYKYLFYLLSTMTCIQELDLGFSNLSHKDVMQIMQLPNVQMRKLSFLNCREIKWPKLLTINVFSNHQSISTLSLSYSSFVTDSVLIYISNTLINLEILNLACCSALTDHGFSQIQNLRKLNELNINNCFGLTGEVLSNLRGCSLKSLKAINVLLNTDHITYYLTNLKLIHCEIGSILKSTRFNDDSINEIIKTQQFLKELHVHSLSLTNRAFLGELTGTIDPGIETVFMDTLNTNLENYNYYENVDTFRHIFQYENVRNEYSISNLCRLEILGLDCCQSISDEVIKYSMDLPCLRELCLSSTKVSFPGICYLVQKCPNLELLDLENTSINDASICILVQALPKLTTLNLKSCSKLTRLSFKLIAKHCHNLKILQGWTVLNNNEKGGVDPTITEIFNLPNMCNLYVTKRLFIEDNTGLLPYANNPFYKHVPSY